MTSSTHDVTEDGARDDDDGRSPRTDRETRTGRSSDREHDPEADPEAAPRQAAGRVPGGRPDRSSGS